jgi:TonB family protein
MSEKSAILSVTTPDACDPCRNVIPLRGLDDARASSRRARQLAAGERDRPAPPSSFAEKRFRFALFLFSSLLVHSALFAFFGAQPETMASVGEDAIIVEIVVGANAAAGIADTRSDVEAERPVATDTVKDDKVQDPTIEQTSVAPPEPAVKPAEEPVPSPDEATPQERNVDEVPKRPEPTPPESTAAPSAPAANSIGRGQMTGDANYQGLVAARLARFKRFPPDARRRREQGRALVSFTIDSSGRATSIRLVQGTGFAILDEEAQAMVRRASPFPSPPGGVATSFSAPVTFHLK